MRQDKGWIVFLFILEIFITAFFIVGYKTRFFTFCLLLLHISFNFRNYLILDGGDCVLINLLIWSLFLPINRRLSIDSFLNEKESREECSSSLISFIFIMQIVFIYFTSAILKVGHWETGEALYYALSLEAYNRPFTGELLNYPNLLKFSSFYVFYLEKYLWLFLFIPFYQKFFRYLTVCLFMSFHCGIIIFMDIGLFPFIGILAWVPLLPGSFWSFFKLKKRKIFKVSLEGKHGLQEKVKEFNQKVFGSAVSIEKNAELSISIKKFTDQFCLDYGEKILTNLKVSNLYKFLYKLKIKKYLNKSEPRFDLSFISRARMILLIFLSVLLLALNLHIMKVVKVPKVFLNLARQIHFEQNWVMFTVLEEYDGWGVAMGITKRGETINLINQNQNVWEKPESVLNYYGGIRWVKFHSKLKEKSYEGFTYNQLTKLYLNYLGQKWNESNPDNLIEYVHYFYVFDEIGTDKTYDEFKRHLIESVEILPKDENE